MRIPYYQVNAFTGVNFRGNPAGVCLLEKEADAKLMQMIATENDLAETAFIVPEKDMFQSRWFTPSTEVDLCGHATLASAFVIDEYTAYAGDTIRFHSKSGILEVGKEEDLYKMNFPSDTLNPVDLPGLLKEAFAIEPVEVFKAKTDYMLVYSTEEEVRNSAPDIDLLKQCDGRGVIITSQGKSVDFISRFFAPQSGIDEDPVTGSAHTTLTPYWYEKLDKTKLIAIIGI